MCDVCVCLCVDGSLLGYVEKYVCRSDIPDQHTAQKTHQSLYTVQTRRNTLIQALNHNGKELRDLMS